MTCFFFIDVFFMLFILHLGLTSVFDLSLLF